MADISFNIAWKEMEIVQIAPVTINSFNFWIEFVYAATTFLSQVVNQWRKMWTMTSEKIRL